MSRVMLRRWELGLLATMVLCFVIAPTPGDIGGCGQGAEQLDAKAFFDKKRGIDCRKCNDCAFDLFFYCEEACRVNADASESFPIGCFPLVHDGEVCLRALEHTSCKNYVDYVKNDIGTRSTPSECNFCPLQ